MKKNTILIFILCFCIFIGKTYSFAVEKNTNYIVNKEENLQEWWDENYLKYEYTLIEPQLRDAKSYDQVINILRDKAKNDVKDKLTKNNMALSMAFFDEAEKLLSVIDKKLSAIKYNDDEIDAYKIIISERKRLEEIKNSIHINGYNYEKKKFKEITGNVFYEKNSEEDDDYTLSALLNFQSWRPEKGYLYDLEYMQVLQVTSDGLILATNSLVAMPNDKNIFLYTDKKFVDGDSLNGYYATYYGIYKYQSILGQRTIHSFRLYNLEDGQVIKGKRFYFYPDILDVNNIKNEFSKDLVDSIKPVDKSMVGDSKN